MKRCEFLVCKNFPMASGLVLNFSSFTTNVHGFSKPSVINGSCSAIALLICMVSSRLVFGLTTLRSVIGYIPRPNTRRFNFLHLVIMHATCAELITKLFMVILSSSVRFSTTQFQSFALRKHSSKDKCRVLRVNKNKGKNISEEMNFHFLNSAKSLYCPYFMHSKFSKSI